MNTKAFYWDWKEQPNWDGIAKAINDLSGGLVHLYEVETGSDMIAIILSSEELTHEQLYKAWEEA